MKITDKNTVTKIIIGILILNSIAGLVIFMFALNLLYNPDSSFNRRLQQNIETYAGNFKPLSIIGEKGDKGEQGAPGVDGASVKGDKGDTGPAGVQGSPGETIVGPQGSKGDQGLQGEKGEQGPRAEFRCNPDTKEDEYKYPGDEDWTGTGGSCVPIEGGSHVFKQ